MLHPCEYDAVVLLPATRLRRRLRHALHGPLAGLGVGGVPGGTEWGILERKMILTQEVTEPVFTASLSVTELRALEDAPFRAYSAHTPPTPSPASGP